ncbi:von Willebrand factor A domain-containing 3A [Schistosoma japonicum]|uniref:von Willebrand factor A domain-containing 3A n=1 Tax=Schistosoma japonicum TaxID=6182 RepID=A0A4Z2DK46_SCHJA|nr:von Willebrand factor A domain-containing 3A [Schistosoma japonicum]
MQIERLCCSRSHCSHISRRKTIFDDVKESRIVFCIDTSGSTYKVWDQICSHVIEHLCKVALINKALYFNVITFDDYVRRFRKRLVIASYVNIQELSRWLRSVCFGTSSYIFPALLASYSHVNAECVILVTDGLVTKELYEIKQLSAVCNSRPLYFTLLTDDAKPDNKAIELASKLILMTCCPKSKLNVIITTFSGCFVQLSPLEWCIKVPSKLYGCPNSCYKYVLENLHKSQDGTTGGLCSVKNSQTHNLSCQNAVKDSACQVSDPSNDTLLTEDSIDRLNNTDQQQIQTNTIHGMNDSQTQTVSGTSEEVTDSNQIITSPSHNEYDENYNHRCMHNSCLVCDNPQNYTDNNKFKESRYRAARSFINGRSQLDWWADDIRIAPSAGALLLGHTVLAPKYNEGNQLFLGTVLSQVDYYTFIISFEDPNLEIKHRENIQETHVHELLSYLDFYRHPINPGDYVLVPQCITNCDQLKNSHKHYLVPYYVGKVLSGYESRSSFKKGNTLSDTPITIEFIRHTNNDSISNRKFQLPFNIVIWIPNDLFEKKFLSRTIQWEFIPSNEESHNINVKTSNPTSSSINKTTSSVYNTQNTEVMKSNKNLLRPFNELAPFSIGGVNNKDNCNKEKGLNYAYTKDQLDQMKNEFIDSDYASSMDEIGSNGNHQKKKISKSESNILSEAFYDFHSDSANQFVESKSYESEKIHRPINKEAYRIYNQMKDVATYVDSELKYGKMHIKWVKDQVKNINRPKWRYWGAKPIPQIIAPPIFEPFKDTTTWGRSDRLTTTGNILRPEIHFNKISPTFKAIDHYNSRNIGLCLMDNSLMNKGTLKKHYSSCTNLPKLCNDRNIRDGKSIIGNNMNYNTVGNSLQNNHQFKTLYKHECNAIKDNQSKQDDFHRTVQHKVDYH